MTSSYSDQEIKVKYRVESYQEQILAFNIDHTKHLLMIISTVQSLNKEKTIFKLLRFNGDLILEQEIECDHLISRFQRNNLVYQEGHFYFENQVIKIRYELIMR